jgi:hypothetical protein
LAPRARLLLSSFSLLAAAHIIRHTVAITAITTATIRATTRAIMATGGVATIGLGGGIGITAGIMAGGAGTAGAAEGGGMAAADAAGMAADGAGMVTIDLKSSPATFWGYLARDEQPPLLLKARGSIFSNSYALTNTKCWSWLLPVCLISKSLINWYLRNYAQNSSRPRRAQMRAGSLTELERMAERLGEV